MQTAKIRKLISKTVSEDARSQNAETLLKTTSKQTGFSFSPKQIREVVQFIREYIENVPLLLEKVAHTARNRGIAARIAPMLDAAERYFLEPEDFIPDELGLLGLLDDAYLAQTLVQTLSDDYRRQSGTPLLNVDLSEGNRVARNLIGEPVASLLDAAVANATGTVQMQEFVQSLASLQNLFPMSAPDPVYGNMSAKEIADVRLGAMGVI